MDIALDAESRGCGSGTLGAREWIGYCTGFSQTSKIFLNTNKFSKENIYLPCSNLAPLPLVWLCHISCLGFLYNNKVTISPFRSIWRNYINEYRFILYNHIKSLLLLLRSSPAECILSLAIYLVLRSTFPNLGNLLTSWTICQASVWETSGPSCRLTYK